MTADIVAIVARALSFIAMLQAAGIAIFLALFGRMLSESTSDLRRMGLWSSYAGVLLVCLHQLLEAARMTGVLSGVLDASLHARSLFSATGLANGLRVVGLICIIVAFQFRRRRSVAIGLIGSLLVASAFAATGHTSINPQRWLLAPLLLLHLWVVAFWFGALWPLYRVTYLEPQRAAAIVARFSSIATWLVPGTALAGVVIATVIVPNRKALLEPYGLLLLGKVLCFSLLMGLAALNKLRWGPALARGDTRAISALRRSVIAEFGLIVVVLGTTATMTSLYSPMNE
ncbi:MAG: CopD family protein [Steroidobacteraceae bacterium]